MILPHSTELFQSTMNKTQEVLQEAAATCTHSRKQLIQNTEAYRILSSALGTPGKQNKTHHHKTNTKAGQCHDITCKVLYLPNQEGTARLMEHLSNILIYK